MADVEGFALGYRLYGRDRIERAEEPGPRGGVRGKTRSLGADRCRRKPPGLSRRHRHAYPAGNELAGRPRLRGGLPGLQVASCLGGLRVRLVVPEPGRVFAFGGRLPRPLAPVAARPSRRGGVVLVVASTFLAATSDAGPPPGAAGTGISSWTFAERMVFIFFGALTAAVVEETIFRGLALTYLPALMPGLPSFLAVFFAVVASALLWVYGHGDLSPGGILTRAVLGLVFSVLFLWRRSLRLPIFLHWLVNATGPATIP